MRVELATQSWGWVADTAGNAQAAIPVTLQNLDGTAATYYAADIGGSSATTPLMTGTDGTLPGWIEEDSYLMTVGDLTHRVEATAGITSADHETRLDSVETVDAAAAVGSLRTLGNGASQAAAGAALVSAVNGTTIHTKFKAGNGAQSDFDSEPNIPILIRTYHGNAGGLPVTGRPQGWQAMSKYFAATTADSAQGGSIASFLVNAGTPFTQTLPVTGMEGDAVVQGGNTLSSKAVGVAGYVQGTNVTGQPSVKLVKKVGSTDNILEIADSGAIPFVIVNQSGHLIIKTSGAAHSAGSAIGAMIAFGNITTAPTANFTGGTGGFLYVEAGALKFRGGAGTITTIGPA